VTELVGTGGGGCGGFFRVQALKLRVAMKKGEVRVAASPHRVSVPRFPGFVQGIRGFWLSLQGAVYASGVVENRGFVGAQGDGQVELAQGVVHTTQFSLNDRSGFVIPAEISYRRNCCTHPFAIVGEHTGVCVKS
jgi:hypothetical protein